MKNDNVTGNETVNSNFLNVLLALKENIMKDLKVAEIGIVKEIKNDLCYCYLLNSKSTELICIKLNNLSLSQNDIVLIVFTNTDFRTNLNRLKNNQETIDYTNGQKHSYNFGVIIGKI